MTASLRSGDRVRASKKSGPERFRGQTGEVCDDWYGHPGCVVYVMFDIGSAGFIEPEFLELIS